MKAEVVPGFVRTISDLDKKPVDFMTFPDDKPEVDARTEALSVPERARSIIVTDQVSLDSANNFLKDIKRLAGRIAETFDPQIDQAHKLHKSLLAEKKKFAEPLERAETAVKRTIAVYLDDEERKRHEQERERARVEDEARKVADKAAEKASKLEEKGNIDKAITVIEDATAKAEEILAGAPTVDEGPRTNGLSLRTEYRFEVIDKKSVPREYLKVDEVKIGRIVRASRGTIPIPGVRIWSEKTVAASIS